MENIIANVDKITFDIELALERQESTICLPFTGMDKSMSPVCRMFSSSKGCANGSFCPYRHIRPNRTVVCKHWLRGLCKKGDRCEFLHEYDMRKMPECYFYSRFNACHNKECPFLHIDPESKIKDCPWYERGFCKHGPRCRHRHVRRVLCVNYLSGFCPEGARCKFVHPRFDLVAALDREPAKGHPRHHHRHQIVCNQCGEAGHKAARCEPAAKEAQDQQDNAHGRFETPRTDGGPEPGAEPFRRPPPPKTIDEVVCFKCGLKGHYANRCLKGHLAFLSQIKIK